MQRGKGKAKGSAFERKVCAALSLWVTNGKNADAFWRSAMSGGRATIHVGKGKLNRQAGDICAVAPEGHVLTDLFFIECKALKDVNLTGFILSDVGPLAKFWKVAVEQAETHGRIPMLIAKQNQQPVLVLTIEGTFAKLETHVELCRAGVCCHMCLFDELMQRPFDSLVNSRRLREVYGHENTTEKEKVGSTEEGGSADKGSAGSEVRKISRHRLTPNPN